MKTLSIPARVCGINVDGNGKYTTFVAPIKNDVILNATPFILADTHVALDTEVVINILIYDEPAAS